MHIDNVTCILFFENTYDSMWGVSLTLIHHALIAGVLLLLTCRLRCVTHESLACSAHDRGGSHPYT